KAETLLAVATAVVDALQRNWLTVLAGLGAAVITWKALDWIQGKIEDSFGIGGDESITPLHHKKGSAADNALNPNLYGDANNNYLQQIAQNTAAMKQDLKSHAFGGGDLGRIGVTPAEMQSYYGSKVGLAVHRGSSSRFAQQQLSEAVENIVNDVIGRKMADMMRLGWFPTN